MSNEVVRIRFAHFVSRTLDSARARGLTDKDIHAATGIMPSTFHRWRRAETRTTPDLGKIRAFCEGLGADIDDAMAALGISPHRDNPEPSPPMDPDLRMILRRLADPNVSAEDKLFIRESLRMLAAHRGRREHRSSGEAVTG